MAMLYAAYFDASGKREHSPVLTVAGAVAPLKKWIRFEGQWLAVLKDEGVSEFHATDFAASAGEYEGWKGDKTRRSKFLARLIAIIKANTNKLFSVSVELAAWNKINAEYFLSERFYSPYSLAGYTVITQALYWAKTKRVRPPEFIFEDGDDGWDGLCKLCKWDNVIPIRLPKQKAIPCQMADMYAWKCRISTSNSLRRIREMEHTDYDERALYELAIETDAELASLRKLSKLRPGTVNLFATETLMRLCRENKIPRRVHPVTLS